MTKTSFSGADTPPVPRYYRVRGKIQKDILEGQFQPGDMLPSERELCKIHGVSNITVRRALRDLVQSGLIYRENGVGTFVAHRTQHYSIALIFCGFGEEGWRRQSSLFGSLIGSVGQVIWAHRATLSVINVATEQALMDAIRQIAENHTFDGFLVRFEQDPSPEFADLAESFGVPYVSIKKRPKNRSINAVWMDNRAHARLATEHLLDLGHKRIACLVGRKSSRTFRDRAAGYLDALATRGLPQPSTFLRYGESEFSEVGYAETLALLDGEERPTGIVIGTDHFIQGTYAALRGRGVSIPDDISLVSFSEMGNARDVHPHLTSLAASDYDMGQEAAKLLIGLVSGKVTTPTEIEIEPRLVIRGTSASPVGSLQSA